MPGLGRFLLLFAIFSGFLFSLGSCATSPPARPDNICAIFYEKDDWFADAVLSEQRWGAPIPIQMAIMRHESSFYYDAKPPRRYMLGFIPWGRLSSAYGYAQATDGTWYQYQLVNDKVRAHRANFNDAVDFIGWYMHTTRKTVGLSLDDAYSHYLAYHEGHQGYRSGSFKKKPRLLSYAQKVAATADLYSRQLAGCRADLEDPGPWWWPF